MPQASPLWAQWLCWMVCSNYPIIRTHLNNFRTIPTIVKNCWAKCAILNTAPLEGKMCNCVDDRINQALAGALEKKKERGGGCVGECVRVHE